MSTNQLLTQRARLGRDNEVPNIIEVNLIGHCRLL
jgi:hypothetical protein